jgi:hypothetical protein
MQKMITESQAKQIAAEYVKAKESGLQTEVKSVERQDIWLMETQTKEANGSQYANVTVSGTGEVKDYTKTRFQSGSVSQRILSKVRNIFSRNKQEEINTKPLAPIKVNEKEAKQE